MDMVIPRDLNPDQDDNAWAQDIIAALAIGGTDDTAHRFVSGDDFVMKDASAHPTSPLPPATSSPAAKKLAKLAVPTRTNTRHKDLLSSKGAKPSPAVKPKAALASLKGKAPAVPLAGPPIGSGPSIPPVNAATICSGVMGMTVADALGATDSNAAIRDNALVSQMADVHKYISEVCTAQLSVPDAPSSEDFHALEESITTLMKSTEGRFTSFQSVLNAIMERITLPALAIVSAPVQALPVPPVSPGLPPVVLDDHHVPVLAPTVPVGNPVPVHAPFSQIGASTLAGNVTVDPSHVFPPYPSAQPQIQLQCIRVDFIDPSCPNDRPTLDDVCGPSLPSLGSGSVPAGYENYAHP
ncbi:hypothetical protein ARMGADRAFT_1023002 [Armillaria gallica]|uniref:Uncharacterized protein n=1 Tax=Armillaria gallica TaxID=47427 RepID=A0A2H3E5B3_ARMGA|nr:hypothetical protein ARMGADRAFT_1023002 [Armillaria gallica]